jgi:hypothetical protein
MLGRWPNIRLVSCKHIDKGGFERMKAFMKGSRKELIGKTCITKLEKLCNHFGKDKKINDKVYADVISIDVVKKESFSFKV